MKTLLLVVYVALLLVLFQINTAQAKHPHGCPYTFGDFTYRQIRTFEGRDLFHFSVLTVVNCQHGAESPYLYKYVIFSQSSDLVLKLRIEDLGELVELLPVTLENNSARLTIKDTNGEGIWVAEYKNMRSPDLVWIVTEVFSNYKNDYRYLGRLVIPLFRPFPQRQIETRD